MTQLDSGSWKSQACLPSLAWGQRLGEFVSGIFSVVLNVSQSSRCFYVVRIKMLLCGSEVRTAALEKDQSPLLGVLQLLGFTCRSSHFMHVWLIRDQRLSVNVKQSRVCQPASMSAHLWTGIFSRFFFSFLACLLYNPAWERLQRLITLSGNMRTRQHIPRKRQCGISSLLLLKCLIICPCYTFWRFNQDPIFHLACRNRQKDELMIITVEMLIAEANGQTLKVLWSIMRGKASIIASVALVCNADPFMLTTNKPIRFCHKVIGVN